MEVLLFLNNLRTKGNLYYQIWMRLLIQYQSNEYQSIKLSVSQDCPKSSYYRIIDYGIKMFPNYVKDVAIIKKKNALIITKKNKAILEEKEVELLETPKKATKPKRPKVVDTNIVEVIDEIIDYLNEKAGKSFKSNSKIAIANINARLKDGYKLDDFKKVIDIKCAKWLGDKMEDYLTPNTLFGNKFEQYLNENIIVPKTKQTKNYEQVIEATTIGWDNDTQHYKAGN